MIRLHVEYENSTIINRFYSYSFIPSPRVVNVCIKPTSSLGLLLAPRCRTATIDSSFISTEWDTRASMLGGRAFLRAQGYPGATRFAGGCFIDPHWNARPSWLGASSFIGTQGYSRSSSGGRSCWGSLGILRLLVDGSSILR